VFVHTRFLITASKARRLPIENHRRMFVSGELRPYSQILVNTNLTFANTLAFVGVSATKKNFSKN